MQIIAEEIKTAQKLSSTATLTVTVTDANDNRPIFEHESYSFSVSETAHANHLIGTITAKDLDSGRFGKNGIRYSLSGAGSHLFNIDEKTGAITVAECEKPQNHHNTVQQLNRKKRQTDVIKQQSTTSTTTAATTASPTNAKKVNLTIVGETGVIDVDEPSSSTEFYFPYTNINDDTFRPYFSADDDYMVMGDDSNEETTTTHEFDTFNESQTNELNSFNELTSRNHTLPSVDGPGHSPCLDYETQSVYFLSYKVRLCVSNKNVFICPAI